MARPVGTDSILEVTNRGFGPGGTIMNVWHYRLLNGGSTLFDGDQISEALRQKIQGAVGFNLLTSLRDMCHETITWLSVRYQWITPLRYTPRDDVTGTGNGTNVDAALPMNVAGVATIRTLFAGRTGRGRKHFGGLTAASVQQSSVSAFWSGLAADVMAEMIEPLDLPMIQANLSLEPVVYHRSNPAISHLIQDYTLQPEARVMRRRTLGVGI